MSNNQLNQISFPIASAAAIFGGTAALANARQNELP
jgi:hypothetical protein